MNDASHVLMAELWRASWQGGVFLGLALILWIWAPRLGNRLVSANTRYWLLWIGIVQLPLRLVFAVPVTVRSTSLVRPAVESAPAAQVDARVSSLPAQSYSPSAAVIVMSGEPELRPAGASLEGDDLKGRRSAERRFDFASMTRPSTEPLRSVRAEPTLSEAAAALYLLGIAACLAVQAARMGRSWRLLRESRPIEDKRADVLLREIAGPAGPRLLEADSAPCALAVGLLRSAIVLPSGVWRSLSDDELRMTLAHELAHHLRRDLWLELPVALARTLFFFHPLAWIARREMTLAREEACDAYALRATSGSRSVYAKLLVRSARGPANAMAMGSSLGYVLLQRRLEMLKGNTSLKSLPPFRLAAGFIAAAAVSAPIVLVQAQTKAHVIPDKPPLAPSHARRAVSRPAQPLTHGKTQALVQFSSATKALVTTDSRFQGVKLDGQTANHQPLLTIRFVGAPLHTALARLFETAGVNYSIRSDVREDTVSCSLHRVTLVSALHTLFVSVRQPLTFMIENNRMADQTYVVIPRSAAPMPPRPAGVPIGAVAPPAPLPQGQPTNPPPSVAVPTGAVVPAAPWPQGNPINPPPQTVVPNSSMTPTEPATMTIPAVATGGFVVQIASQDGRAPIQSQVRWVVANLADVREVIKRLLRRSGVSYTIADDVRGIVTLQMRNLTCEFALKNILRQVDSTYRVENGVVRIVRIQN